MLVINKYEKALLFKPAFMRFLWLIIVVLNWILPLRKDYVWDFSVFRLIMTVVWTYGMLTATGVLCINTYVVENGMILYEQNTSPVIVALGLTRIFQSVYYVVLKADSINWIVLLLLVVIDVVYLFIILLDKSSYGYALEEKEKFYKF